MTESTDKTTQFHQLFTAELEEMLWASEHLLKLLYSLTLVAENDSLKSMLHSYLDKTVVHVQRLKDIFERLKQQPKTRKCQGMAGLIIEAGLLIEHTDQNAQVTDTAILMIMQKINQYEMTGYESMVTFAEQWHHHFIKEILLATLKEKWQADTALASITLMVMTP